jgi:hypothetical protein
MNQIRVHLGLIAVLIPAVFLGACGGGDKKEPTATAAPGPTTVADSAVTEGTLVSSGSNATDGLCQVTIPETWVDDGTGRGVTSQGDQWSVFGNKIASDEAWNSARDLLKSQMSSHPGADIKETDDSITVTLANGRGYVERVRFKDRYCEFSVMSTRDQPDNVTATWISVAQTLAPYEE